MNVKNLCIKAKEASRKLALVDTPTKDKALRAMAKSLVKNIRSILEANSKDVRSARSKDVSSAFLERLTLSRPRIEAMARKA